MASAWDGGDIGVKGQGTLQPHHGQIVIPVFRVPGMHNNLRHRNCNSSARDVQAARLNRPLIGRNSKEIIRGLFKNEKP